jgi:mono/diheme cytochrome c family protein
MNARAILIASSFGLGTRGMYRKTRAMRRILALVALAGCSGPHLRPPAPGDPLAISGAVEGGRLGIGAADLAALPRRTVRGVEPHDGREASFQGADLAPFLSERVPLKPGADVAIFHGRGGYRAAVPLNAIRQSRPVLASAADGKKLDEWDPAAGPLLLAWPDSEAPGLDSDPRQRWFWVRGVTLIELGLWQDGPGRALRVPPGAGDDARRGAEAFGAQCIHCHRLRGRGGEVGPDLTSWMRSAADASRLAEVLKDHLARKSGLKGVPEPGAQEVREVGAFLRSLALAGADGADEPRGEEPPRPRPPGQPGQPGGPRRP